MVNYNELLLLIAELNPTTIHLQETLKKAVINQKKNYEQYDKYIKSCPTNLAHHKVFHPKHQELFQKNEKDIKPFGLQMETIIGEAEVDLTEVHKTIIPDIPPWTIRTPNIILTLCKFHKNKTHPLIFQEELEKVKEKYPKHLHIFMDGSKLDKITGCATIHEGKFFF